MTGDNDTANDTAVDDSETGASDTTDETTDETTDNAETDNSESDAADGGTAKESGDEDEEEEDDEPPTRKPRTPADFVALRRQKKLEKAKKGEEEQREMDDDEDDQADDLEINEEDAKIVEKIVDQRLKPFEQQQAVAAIKQEIDDFVASNPDFKPFADKAVKWALHPSWKNVPTQQLMYAVAGPKLLKIGAQRQIAAIKKANETKTGSSTGGEAGSGKPVWEMTDAEFAKEVENVKLGQ